MCWALRLYRQRATSKTTARERTRNRTGQGGGSLVELRIHLVGTKQVPSMYDF